MADVLIFDTPPVLAVTDAQVIGRLVDGTVLVINTEQTSGAAVRQALESLMQVNVPLVGAVLIGGSSQSSGYYYYMHSYYHYHEDTPDAGDDRKQDRADTAVGKQETATAKPTA